MEITKTKFLELRGHNIDSIDKMKKGRAREEGEIGVIINNLFLKVRHALGKLKRFVFFYPYTLGGKIQVKYFSCKKIDSKYPFDKPIVYTKEEIASYIDKVARKEVFDYGETDTWLYQALEKYSIRGKDVAIIGSVIPRYESVCLFYGGRPTTIEYNKRISEDSRIKTLTVEEFNKNPRQFDAAFSISSFEHDGLGRYGDPLNPSGDFEAMRKTKKMIRGGGYFIPGGSCRQGYIGVGCA